MMLMTNNSKVSWNSIPVEAINSVQHRIVNYEAALQSFVLLKNEDNVLPLKAGSKIAVVGPQVSRCLKVRMTT
jgi:beta-glucosidase